MKRRELIVKIIAFALIALSMVISHYSHADSLGLNSQPIFYSLLNQNPVYHDAAFKAQEAFFIQTGITPMTDKITGYVTDNAQNKATAVINNDTPLDAKTVYFITGAAYTVCVKKQVNQHFRDPFFTSVTHTVHIDQSSVSTGIQIPLPF